MHHCCSGSLRVRHCVRRKKKGSNLLEQGPSAPSPSHSMSLRFSAKPFDVPEHQCKFYSVSIIGTSQQLLDQFMDQVDDLLSVASSVSGSNARLLSLMFDRRKGGQPRTTHRRNGKFVMWADQMEDADDMAEQRTELPGKMNDLQPEVHSSPSSHKGRRTPMMGKGFPQAHAPFSEGAPHRDADLSYGGAQRPRDTRSQPKRQRRKRQAQRKR